jgi:hypothetical protein
LLGEAIEEAAVAGGDFAEEAAEAVEVVGVLSGGTKGHTIIGFGMGRPGGRGKGVTVVEKIMDGNLDGAGEFFEGLNGGNGMAVFDAREIAAEQSGAILDIALGEIALFPKQAEALTYSHYG